MRRRDVAACLALLILGAAGAGAAAGGPAADQEPAREFPFRPLAAGAVPEPLRQVPAAMRAAKEARRGSPPQPHKLRDANENKLQDQLEEVMAQARPQDALDVVVVTETRPADSPALRQLMAQAPVRRVFERAIQGFSARLTPAQIRQLQSLPEVKAIEANERVYAFLDSATYWSGASLARRDFWLSGDRDGNPRAYTTGDVVIAIIDTGIDPHHLDLEGKVIGWADMVSGQPEPYDDNGHGTHVAGIAAGAGRANPALKGVAPGAALVGVKVLSAEGSGTLDWVISGVEWVIANKERYNIQVLNMSLGTRSCSDGLDALSQAVNAAVEAGIVAVVAAGNRGPDNCTVGSPAAAERAITVAAMRDIEVGGWTLAPWSSRGPTLDGRKKPDIAAPGSRITAPMAGTRDRYVTYTGTSMASPMVAGTVALMLSARRDLSPAQVKQILMDTAQDWGLPGKDVDYGAGKLNAYRAVQRVVGLRGYGPPNPIHGVGMGQVAAGESVFYRITVTDEDIPVGLTLIMPDWAGNYVDLDLYLYDGNGVLVAESYSVDRQETIMYRPPHPGDYYIEVYGFEGSGRYVLDASWR